MFKKIILSVILLASGLHADAIPDKIKQQNINVVQAAAKGLNKTLPQKIDPYTSLVKLEPKGERLLYIYEINDPSMSDEEISKRGKEKMKAPVIRGICSSSKRFLESGIDITYLYKSAKSKKELFRFDVTKKDCHY
jgi:hypothetical protein